ncbi:MAG: serine/threonine protein kinase [Ilumatobacter sp.]
MKIADYEVIDTVGDGNHGVYHTAKPPTRLGLADPVVTLKVLDDYGSADDFRRITNELRLLHSLRSPHLVELLDAGSVDGRMYLATRHYPAGALDSASGLSRSARVAVVADAARGAHQMHEVGVAHRDINPSNIFIDRTRGRLADLGLAETLAGATATIGTGPLGSLQFIDPDLVWGGKASRATDIWSLGITLHCSLSDLAPFGDIPTDNLLSAFRHVVHTPPQLDHTFEPELLGVVHRSLAPIEQRFDTALALANALDDVSRQLADVEAHDAAAASAQHAPAHHAPGASGASTGGNLPS